MTFLRRHRITVASLLLCLLSLHISFTGKKGAGAWTIVNGAVSLVLPPVQELILKARKGVTGLWYDYIFLVGVREENEILRRTLMDLVEENNRLREEVKLNSRLRDVLAFKEKTPVETMAAEIIGFNIREWTRTVTINKGSSDGVVEDMPVISPEGVVGRVVSTGLNSSKVLLVTDPRSSLDAIVQRTRVKGVVEGFGTEGLKLKYIRQLDDVRVGDIVVTAGLSGIFPKGILIGEVSKIEKGEDNFFKYIEVRPGVDIQRLEEVLLVKKGPDRGAHGPAEPER